VSNPSDSPTILLETTDLFFRAKLDGIVRAMGGVSTRVLPADLAVIELGRSDATARVRTLVEAGVPVLAFGSHMATEELRAAREAGATAVPNSQVESALRTRLAELS
jgi:hypothetical protein